jgi:pilus assembly protein CpaB
MYRITPGMMTVGLFALLVGLGGAYVVRHHLAIPQQAPIPPELVNQPLITVPVALTDLEVGRVLSINDIGIQRFASNEDYKKSQYAKTSHLTTPTQIAGRTLRTPIKKGATFNPDDLFAFGDTPGIEERLEAGYRAVSVPIKNDGVVQGFARPGSFVDVLFRADSNGERPEVTLTLFERIEVLALNTSVLTGRAALSDTGSVTVAVTPHQAKVLKVVEGRGEISLVLRNPEDDFQFMPFDPGMNRGLSQIGNAALRPVGFHANTAKKRTDADRIDADRIDGIDRVIGNASERVTIDDLLGMTANPKKKKMDIYLGGAKKTQEFDELNDESLETLRSGGRISTPIVERPFRRPQPLGTAQASPRTN